MQKSTNNSESITNKKYPLKNDKKEKVGSLIPAIIQDVDTKEILMLAYMNRESFIKSLQTGYTWFFSRERGCIWNKGETSGNYQKIIKLFSDCDNDALVFQVKQKGAACHTGNRSCFFNEIELDRKEDYNTSCNNLSFGNYSGIYDNSGEKEIPSILFLQDLYNIVSERIREKSEKSYTYNLHKKGMDEILKKIGEESIEIILAAAVQEKKQVIYEMADFLYHLIVLMFEKKISFEDIIDELKSRHK